MQKSTLTSKGQLTLPKSIRERLDLKPGDTLTFEVEGDDAMRVSIRRRRPLSELKGSLASDLRYEGRKAEREAARGYVSNRREGSSA